MKTLYTLIFLLLITNSYRAQDFIGSWYGSLKIQGTELRLVFNISQNEENISATMDSPDQGAKGIPFTKVEINKQRLTLQLTSAKIEYTGELNQQQEIVGTFIQGGQSLPLNLSKKKSEKAKLNRPQEPKQPYAYYSENVSFENKKAGIVLSGTLTLPKKEGVFPVVVLISGSGPQNRDEELLGHKPFLILSDYLTNNGIAVLRYDDRGTAASTGDFKAATSADFFTDVTAAVEYLKTRKEINKKKIGLIGHSEGGVIAPMVAAQSKDIDFIVLLAGTGIRGDKLLLLQAELIAKASGVAESDIQQSLQLNKGAFEIVINSNTSDQLQVDLKNYFTENMKNAVKSNAEGESSTTTLVEEMQNSFSSPWIQYFIKLDPAIALRKVKCPVLALNGEKDLQVPPKENLNAIKIAVESGGNKNVTVKELPQMNHLFQVCETGNPSEYATIEETFSPIALNDINVWIQQQIK